MGGEIELNKKNRKCESVCQKKFTSTDIRRHRQSEGNNEFEIIENFLKKW